MGNARVLRRLPRVARAKRRPDQDALRKAVKDFLTAAGVDLGDPNLRETPERVAETWVEDFLDGYQKTAEDALGETYPAPGESDGGDCSELVLVTGLKFHSMCPHHLLPYSGTAHVAYIPKGKIVGFGRLGTLLDVFAHRLILQEELARQVAKALVDPTGGLGAAGGACVIEADHACMQVRGGVQAHAKSHAEAYEGILRTDRDLRRELWARLHR